ncbi:MAG: hypothetical protein WEB06_01030 [Actinomycetota bacterium]
MSGRSRPLTMFAASLLMAALVAGCGGGPTSQATPGAPSTAASRPSSTAKLKILLPKAGDAQGGPTVTLRVGLDEAKLVEFTSSNLKPNEGHLHVLLDGRLISMTLGLEQQIPDVAAGSHVIRVEFVASDHAPFAPRVVQEVTFEVT